MTCERDRNTRVRGFMVLSMVVSAITTQLAHAQTRADTLVVIGCVTDSLTGLAVGSVQLLWPGTRATFMADSNGFFEGRIARSLQPTSVEVRRIGYAVKRVALPSTMSDVLALPLVELAVSPTADTFGGRPITTVSTPEARAVAREAQQRPRARCAERVARY